MKLDSLENIKKSQAEGMSKEQALFHKLCLCIRKICADHDRLGCHFITTAKYLGICIESNYTYYDTLTDVWCDYFLNE